MSLSPQAKRRLGMLLKDLRTRVKPCLFDMHWFGKGFVNKDDRFVTPHDEECGTAACAAGWFAILHPRCGLKLKFEGVCEEIEEHQVVGANVYYKGIYGYTEGQDAVAECFNIFSEKDLLWLFYKAKRNLEEEALAIESYLEADGDLQKATSLYDRKKILLLFCKECGALDDCCIQGVGEVVVFGGMNTVESEDWLEY